MIQNKSILIAGDNGFIIGTNRCERSYNDNTIIHEWIKENYNLCVEVKHDESQMWGYIVWRMNMKTSTEGQLIYIDSDSMFKSKEVAFDEGLQRAIYEIKYNSK